MFLLRGVESGSEDEEIAFNDIFKYSAVVINGSTHKLLGYSDQRLPESVNCFVIPSGIAKMSLDRIHAFLNMQVA